MSSRITIRGTAVAAGTAVAGAAVAAGLSVTGQLSDLTPSAAKDRASSPANVGATGAASFTDFTADPGIDRTLVAHGRHRAAKRVDARKDARRAAKQAAAARALARTSRSATRSFAGDPRSIARSMMASRYGWGASEYSCLNSLWNKESGWNVHATNASSGAYGIPQALPGSKMSTAGADWRDNPATQITWGLSYIKSSYADPCSAWSTAQSRGWY